MIERRIQIQKGQRLTLVELAADAVVAGWDEADVLLRLREGAEEDLEVTETDAGPEVTARRACEVQAPAALPLAVRHAKANLKVTEVANLAAEQVRGNLKLSEVGEAAVAEVYGNLKAEEVASLRVMGTVYGDASLDEVETVDLQNVRGNLRVKEATRLRVSRISGNLVAKQIGGALICDQVGGNATLKEVAGAVTLDQVAGNLTAKGLTGGASVTRIGGNLLLNGELGTGCTYSLKADGNAVLRLHEGAGAHLTLNAKGKVLASVRLTDEQRTARSLSGTAGSGGPEIAIDAGGNIVVSDAHAEADVELGEEISRQVQESLRAIDLEGIGRKVSEEMEAARSRLRVKMESMDWERMGHRAQESVERAMQRMQQDVDRLAEKAARRQEWLERKAERETRRRERWEVRFQAAQLQPAGAEDMPAEDAAEAADPDPDRDQERLTILKMVEHGQIRPEEAEMLLDALA